MDNIIEIKAAEEHKALLQAAARGDIEVVSNASDSALKSARCSSGCTALHWAAGANQLDVISTIVRTRGGDVLPVDVRATRKARGRTPLHYACRNGRIEAAKLLVELGANVDARAKHGVSPFQLAVWQNHVPICRWLVEEMNVDPAQLNQFDCGAVHWIGICPSHRADRDNDCKPIGDEDDSDSSYHVDSTLSYETGLNLIPLAEWLARQPGIDFSKLQRQGHSPLHKAAWGGHVALLRYLRDEHNLLDNSQDFAGNYAADLARMANSERHSLALRFLLQECSADRARSCAVLGVDIGASDEAVRRAYVEKARLLHPDRCDARQSSHLGSPPRGSTAEENSSVGSMAFVSGDAATTSGGERLLDANNDFADLHKAYKHLTEDGGIGSQRNPSHCINLMLEVSAPRQAEDPLDEPTPEKPTDTVNDESCLNAANATTLFKARLIAVLLEYGDKGLSLSNVKKKWRQVWPETPFPEMETDMGGGRKRKGRLVDYISSNAGDVVDIVKLEGENECLVVAKHCRKSDVGRTLK